LKDNVLMKMILRAMILMEI